jgi:hypothetical protein
METATMPIVPRVLTERRKADRNLMANLLAALVRQCGAECERIDGDEGSYPGPNAIALDVRAARGLCVTVSLRGRSPHEHPDTFLLSWNVRYPATARLNEATFGGNVNPYHKQKASYVAHGFDDLCRQLSRGLRMAADGSAFLP